MWLMPEIIVRCMMILREDVDEQLDPNLSVIRCGLRNFAAFPNMTMCS